MFVLIGAKDTLRLKPQHLALPQRQVAQDYLQVKYGNRVVPGEGLCIAVYDFSHGEAVVHEGDGGAYMRAQFRLLMFRPSVGQILVGTVRQADPTGLLVSLKFFQHIIIPKDKLKDPSVFNAETGDWDWQYAGDDGQVQAAPMEIGAAIRFRVEALQFTERTLDDKTEDAVEDATPPSVANLRPPMRIMGSIIEEGLGLARWWEQGQEEDEGDEGEGEGDGAEGDEEVQEGEA